MGRQVEDARHEVVVARALLEAAHEVGDGDIELAIRREKQMKEWKRLWKLRVIEEMNPDWNDLFESLL